MSEDGTTLNALKTVLGDLREYEDVKKAVEGVDAIYHIAAAFGGPFDNRQYLAINGMGTLNILECVREFNPNIHRLVYACTEAIYWELTEKGRLFDKLITEDMVAKYHHMPYFLTKWIGEETMHDLSPPIRCAFHGFSVHNRYRTERIP